MNKILLATLEYPPVKGGVSRYLYSLHNGMEIAAIQIVSLKSWKKLGWLTAFFEIRGRMKASAAERLAISHILPMGYIALLLKWFYGIQFFVFVHGLDLALGAKSWWKRFWLRKIMRAAKRVIANSNFTKDLAIKLGAQGDKVEVITPCLSGNYSAAAGKERANDGTVTILTVSRLVPRKNHKLIATALAELKKTYKLRWVIVGDGPERKSLVNNSRELYIEDIVEMHGEVADEELEKIYEQADIFVLPAKSSKDDPEGFGIVYLEAAARGLPVIAGRGGGVEEAVIDGETGILIDPESKAELVSAIKQLIDEPDYGCRLGEAGRARILRDFGCASRRKKLHEIYNQR